MSFNVVIPARLDSSRLEEKVLIEINGIPMVIHVAQRASLSGAKNVVIATDDKKIAEVARHYNFKSVMTNKNHLSGTDRCLEASEIIKWDGQDIIVNVQADEPLIDPALIDLLAKNIIDGQSDYVTACSEFKSYKEFVNPSNVKVILDNFSNALYFSRSPIPYIANLDQDKWMEKACFWKHIGIYAWRIEVLKKLVKLDKTDLEKNESLEQLRWLYNGYKIATIETTIETPNIAGTISAMTCLTPSAPRA